MTLPVAVGADANLIATGLPASSGVTFQLYFNGSTTPTTPTNTPAQVGTTARWQVTLTAGERDNESVAVVLSGATIVGTSRDYVNQSKQGAVEANVATWRGATPSALTGGRVQSAPLKQDVADALDLAPTGPAASGSVNHVLPLGNAPTAGALLTGGVGANQINTTTGAADANVWGWQDEALTGTKMIQDATTTPKWTAAALSLAPGDSAADVANAIGTRQVPDAVAAPGQRPTYDQALYMLAQEATDFEITDNGNGTSTLTIKKPDNTTLATLTLNGDQTTPPTSKVRAT